ncbi:hypothetical protein D6D04_02257 [Aureobasidium pullulans]|nr:hypothetical protein D6D04_02257 [Aureobasidium pullulans]
MSTLIDYTLAGKRTVATGAELIQLSSELSDPFEILDFLKVNNPPGKTSIGPPSSPPSILGKALPLT